MIDQRHGLASSINPRKFAPRRVIGHALNYSCDLAAAFTTEAASPDLSRIDPPIPRPSARPSPVGDGAPKGRMRGIRAAVTGIYPSPCPSPQGEGKHRAPQNLSALPRPHGTLPSVFGTGDTKRPIPSTWRIGNGLETAPESSVGGMPRTPRTPQTRQPDAPGVHRHPARSHHFRAGPAAGQVPVRSTTTGTGM